MFLRDIGLELYSAFGVNIWDFKGDCGEARESGEIGVEGESGDTEELFMLSIVYLLTFFISSMSSF